MIGKFLFFGGVVLLLVKPCAAFTLTPISVTLIAKGAGASTSLRVNNESAERVAFQLSVLTREMDEGGVEVRQPVTNLFTLFPPQGAIAPGQGQNVRLIWKGPSITNEMCYRIVAEQLPVDFAPRESNSRIKVLVRYVGSIYVCPKNAKPHLQALSLTKLNASTNAYSLTITNTGKAHKHLYKDQLILTDAAGGRTTLSTDQLSGIDGEVVLAHHMRRFTVVLPETFKEERYSVQLQLDE